MKLIVNGKTQDVSAQSLDALLRELEFEGEWLATALNGELVRSKERHACRLNEGDRIEILTPRQGG
ncbi:thiamine biosynthesis protein ThiS [Phyllobacterium brassicacearum]|uniref:Thiamine biosynthesis protein ThiS n=1 Tax=Phyllobacterium brassicacearum TaxID=314235 RepID=A0A2P7BTQ2_9HYPH|nr:sulfur carrier protein ThiS [Phyllobacterium brassicacearum]PSH69863.1 thiamine biosynthesis protein ThiS [Phyllobacterium brassicacearum]TDQ35032.1 sulfur carrier protein [Phyllobacterium brassicacearum]